MEHIKSVDLNKIAGMFLERDQLCLLTNPNYYTPNVDSWELINIFTIPPLLPPMPTTPPPTN